MYSRSISLADSVNEDWVHHPGLAASCLDTYMKDIQFCLQSEYLSRISKIQPLVDDVLEVDLSKEHMCVPVELFALQKDNQTCTNYNNYSPVYNSRLITNLEDILIDSIEPGIPLNVQKFDFNRLLAVSGAGGQGKTTQLLNLASDWSTCRSYILSQYSLLFYIPLNNLSTLSTFSKIEDVICEGCGLLPVELKAKLTQCLSSSSRFKILFLFDDYKGTIRNCKPINDIINGCSYPNASVLICGRPYWMKNLSIQRDPDAIVDIIGLTDESVDKLFKNFLHQDEVLVKELMDICTQYIFDITLLRIPLFATLCCYIYQANYAQNMDVCQHTRPTTTTELFNCILRIFLKVFARKTGRHFSVSFNKSPIADIDTEIPADIKRLLYQLGKMSFYGIMYQKEHFNERDLKQYMIDPNELSNLGILICTSSQQIPGRVNQSNIFSFRNKMFQEYMAGLYLAEENSAWKEITELFSSNQMETSDDISTTDDNGYHSLEVIHSPGKKKIACKMKSLLQHLMFSKSKRANYNPCDATISKSNDLSSEGNEFDTKSTELVYNSRYPTEHFCSDFQNSDGETELKVTESSICVYLRETDMGEILPQNDLAGLRAGNYHQPSPVSKTYLYNLLSPFQNCVMFACGVNSCFTRKVLSDSAAFVTRKVCKWNNDKFDVGYEALLYCEAQDRSIIHDFYRFLVQTKQKTPSVIQFPRPYDEVATVRLAEDLSSVQAEDLLKKWYSIDLHGKFLQGANIVRSDVDFIEMSDPCLFEVLLLHKFRHCGVTKVKAIGNYFLGFKRLSNSFPDLQELVYDGVNIPSFPKTEDTDMDETSLKDVHFLTKLKHLELLNVRASYYICPELQGLFKSCSLDKLCLERVQCNYQELFAHVLSMENLEKLMMSKMSFSFDDLVPDNNGSNTAGLKLCDVLKDLKILSSLDLSDNNIGIALPEIIFVFQNLAIEELRFNKCRIPATTFGNCSSLFPRLQQLRHLDIGSNPVQHSLGSLLYWLGKCPNLQALGLRKCNLNPDHFKEAAKYFKQLTNLSRLDISDNVLGCATGVLLENVSKSVEELFIENCDIKSADVINGAKVFQKLPNLCRLDIQGNPIHAGIETVVRALKKSKSIEVLHMQNCRIMPKHFALILPLIASLPNLVELGIGKNTCCNETYDARNDLVKYLCQCRKLEKVLCCVLFEKSLEHRQIEQLRKKIKNVTIFRIEH